jgi:hypothetical protein
MSYLPVYCDACLRASLSPLLPDDAEQPHRCSFCEGAARVVPGPTYGDGDWLAFAEIDAAVFEAEIDGARAQVLLAELESLRDRGTGTSAAAEFLLGKLPQLSNAQGALAVGWARGLRMLQTLLIARTRDGRDGRGAPLQWGTP